MKDCGQVRKRLQYKLKLTGCQSIHPAQKFAQKDKFPQDLPPTFFGDTLMGMKPWEKQPSLGLLPLISLVTSPHLYIQ